jgi:hypothetical protein
MVSLMGKQIVCGRPISRQALPVEITVSGAPEKIRSPDPGWNAIVTRQHPKQK